MTLDSGKLMYSGGSNDECYTPDYGVKPILKYIPKDAVVWCPFDTQESEFVKQIEQQNESYTLILLLVGTSLIMNRMSGT